MITLFGEFMIPPIHYIYIIHTCNYWTLIGETTMDQDEEYVLLLLLLHRIRVKRQHLHLWKLSFIIMIVVLFLSYELFASSLVGMHLNDHKNTIHVYTVTVMRPDNLVRAHLSLLHWCFFLTYALLVSNILFVRVVYHILTPTRNQWRIKL